MSDVPASTVAAERRLVAAACAAVVTEDKMEAMAVVVVVQVQGWENTYRSRVLAVTPTRRDA